MGLGWIGEGGSQGGAGGGHACALSNKHVACCSPSHQKERQHPTAELSQHLPLGVQLGAVHSIV